MLRNYNSYLLLLESKRKDQLKSKYIDKLGMPENIFNKLYSKNAEWLMKTYSNTPQEKINEIELETSYSYDDLLLKYANIFDNNKENLSVKQIGKIKGVEQMKEILDEIRGFDDYETDYRDDDIWVLENGYEWFIFKAYDYDLSELANNKKRSSNWCTTYDEGHFKSYFGPEGGLLYMCNKLESTEDMAFEFSTSEINAWDHNDDNKYTKYNLIDLIEICWSPDELPFKVLKSNLKELEEDIPEVDWETAKENAREEIRNWEYSRYNDLEIYAGYVWNHVNDDSFLDDMKDSEYERYNYDWQYENDLLEKFKNILYEYFSKGGYNRKKIKQIFIEAMIKTNDENESVPGDDNYYDVEDPDYDQIERYIDDTYTDSDAKELIEQFGFQDALVEELVDEYIGNFSSAKDYVENIYGDVYSSEAIGYVEGYINYSDLAYDIVGDMEEETLRHYL